MHSLIATVSRNGIVRPSIDPQGSHPSPNVFVSNRLAVCVFARAKQVIGNAKVRAKAQRRSIRLRWPATSVLQLCCLRTVRCRGVSRHLQCHSYPSPRALGKFNRMGGCQDRVVWVSLLFAEPGGAKRRSTSSSPVRNDSISLVISMMLSWLKALMSCPLCQAQANPAAL
jgi:hypothetical protein